jgi:hypothetical protein
MARKLIRRYLPDPEKLRAHRSLRMFARWLQHPNLWHINRRGVSVGLAVGLFWAFIPMPLQMVPSTAFALVLRANIPAAIAGAWVTNPLTMAPAVVLCYRVGAWILGEPARTLHPQVSWDWVTSELALVWEPFLLGCVIVGMVAAALGYLGIQLLWRWHVVRAWERRATRSIKTRR